MALPAAIAPTLAVTAIKEGLSLCQSILEYRIATQQNEIQRKRMHTEANIVLQQLDHDHNMQMTKINTLAEAHKITLTNHMQSSADNVQIIAECQQQITQLLNAFSEKGLTAEVRSDILSAVSMLSQQQSGLMNRHIENSKAPINAFAMLVDGMRDDGQPRTFTDVS